MRWRDEQNRNRSKVLGTKRDAEAFEAELRRKKRTGEIAHLDAGKDTLADFGLEWWRLCAEPNLAEAALIAYAGSWDRHLLPFHGDRPIRDIAVLTSSACARTSRRRASDRGRCTRRSCCSAACSIALSSGGLPSNPVRSVREPHQRRGRSVQPLTPEQVEAVRAQLLADGRLRNATLVSVLAYAGLRPGEALGLSWQSIRARTILVDRAVALGSIKSTKTGTTRTVPLIARRLDARGLAQLAAAALPAGRRRRRARDDPPVRPAPLLRLASDPRGPVDPRGRAPSRPFASDVSTRLRTPVRRIRPRRAGTGGGRDQGRP